MTQLYGLEGASRVHQVQAPRWTAETSFWILSSTQKLTFYVVQEYFFLPDTTDEKLPLLEQM